MHDPAPLDRRPLASRELRSMQRLAAALAARGVSPNAISLLGMVAGLGAGVVLAGTGWGGSGGWGGRACWLAGAALIQLRLLCNLIDGMVAVQGDRRTPVGELYNEAPDRLSDAATLIGAGLGAGAAPWLGLGAALAAVLTAYVRALGKGLTAVNDFRGPMAKQHRMAVMTIACLFLGLAPGSWRPTLEIGDRPMGLMGAALAVVIVGCAITCARRLGAIARALEERAP